MGIKTNWFERIFTIPRSRLPNYVNFHDHCRHCQLRNIDSNGYKYSCSNILQLSTDKREKASSAEFNGFNFIHLKKVHFFSNNTTYTPNYSPNCKKMQQNKAKMFFLATTVKLFINMNINFCYALSTTR